MQNYSAIYNFIMTIDKYSPAAGRGANSVNSPMLVVRNKQLLLSNGLEDKLQ